MKKHFLLILLYFFALTLHAQKSLNVDFFLGTSNYSGDLQEKRFTFSQAHLAGGIGLSYEITNQFSIRTAFKLGKVSADDSKGRNRLRNLNFSSMISEGAVDVQYFFSPLGTNPLTPYGFIGLAVYHFSPYTFDSTGQKYFLKPLSTEGEGFIDGRPNYNLTQLAIPFGAGVKLSLSENINVGFEIGIRKLFTDYLDDVSTSFVDPNLLLANRGAKAVELSYRGDEVKGGSQTYPPVGQQRGSPNYKDWYYFTGLTLSYRLGNDFLSKMKDAGHERRVRKHKQWDCPGNVL
jgi:hypothetical protein